MQADFLIEQNIHNISLSLAKVLQMFSSFCKPKGVGETNTISSAYSIQLPFLKVMKGALVYADRVWERVGDVVFSVSAGRWRRVPCVRGMAGPRERRTCCR